MIGIFVEKSANKKPKPKKCKVCGDIFRPTRGMQSVCGFLCAAEHGRRKSREEFAKETSRRKMLLSDSDKGKQRKAAQAAFNAYIRLRDEGEPCISCGKTEAEIPYTGTGGRWDCGHYRSVGAQPALRFNPQNAYKQCKPCNAGSKKYAGKGETVREEYEKRLRVKIGNVAVDWLNRNHAWKEPTALEYKEIAKHWRAKKRELEKSREAAQDIIDECYKGAEEEI